MRCPRSYFLVYGTHAACATQHNNMAKRERRKFDVKFKEQALRYAAEHSGEKAAKQFNTDPKQIRYWKKQKNELMAADNKRSRLTGGGRKKVSEDMECLPRE